MRATVLLMALGLLLAANAASASAASVARQADGSLRYTGTGTEANQLTVSEDATRWIFTDPVGVTPGTGCEVVSGTSARCLKSPPSPTAQASTVVIDAGDGDDTVDAGAVSLAPAAFTLLGGAGTDTLSGTARDDVIDGGAGGDALLRGNGGADEVSGGEGDDVLRADAGADTLRGGDGYDRYEPQASAYGASGGAADVTVTLDDVANDGQTGEGDDVRTDIEDVTAVNSGTAGTARLTGDGDVNFLTGSSGADVLDGAAGGDVLNGLTGDDTLNARDGFADRVECGPGADTATVDELDSVQNCETVNRAALPPVPVVPDDASPTVSYVFPAENALLGASSNIAVDAADDRGIKRVVLVDDGQIVGTDTTAPYLFRYRPKGADVGRNTLMALAVDSTDQTGSAVRVVRVDRFLPAVRARLAPSRDRRAPFRFRVTGAILPPGDVAASVACRTGTVQVRVRRGGRTILRKRVPVRRTCRYTASVRLGASRAGSRLAFSARFSGNATLRPRTAPSVRGRAG